MHRKRGIGSALMTLVHKRADRNGNDLFLTTARSGAAETYRSLGYDEDKMMLTADGHKTGEYSTMFETITKILRIGFYKYIFFRKCKKIMHTD